MNKILIIYYSLEPTDKEIQNKMENFFKNQNMFEEKLFGITPYHSGDMVAIIYLQRKFREWK